MWNNALNKGFKDKDLLYLEKFQKYVPIYQRFTEINESNFDTFSPYLEKKLVSVESRDENSNNKFKAKLYDINTKKTTLEDVFFKFSPLVDPIKYSTGKYETDMDKLFDLPGISNNDNVYEKMLDVNNSAYVDCYFTYLSSKLFNKGFVHGMNFYGTHLAVQNNYKINVSDDFEFMCSSSHFIKNVGTNFDIVNYDEESPNGRHSSTSKFKNRLSINDDVILEDTNDIIVSEQEKKDSNIKTVFLEPQKQLEKSLSENKKPLMLSDLGKIETFEIDVGLETIKLDEEDEEDEENDEEDDNSSCLSVTTDEGDEEDDDEEDEEDEDDDEDSDEESECENLYLHIKKFPVMLICMEKCDNTYDQYITQNNLSEDEWTSSLFQIIMMLLTYQKIYKFTHNDLHTNNIMYIETKETYLYYVYEGINYRIPTYGKIFKLIDFGRAIYENNSMIFCSNSYDKGEDAYSQYNMEPYYNPEKKKIGPNMSFDLCRLGCSMFDFFVVDIDDVEDMEKKDPIFKLISSWCKDDKGKNILYKTTGEERYPDFKLYKMIVRTVHNHTPESQLKRPEFSKYLVENEEIDGLGEKCIVMNIDKMISEVI